jgi:hypothetical protein
MVTVNAADVAKELCKPGDSADLCKLRGIAAAAKVVKKGIDADENKKFELIKNNTEFVVLTPKPRKGRRKAVTNKNFGLSGTYSVYQNWLYNTYFVLT